MKKMIFAVMVLAVAGAQIQTAQASDREWAVAGKVLTGVLAASVVTRAFEATPGYAYATPAYGCAYSYYPAPPPVVVYAPPPPVVVYPAPVNVAAPMVSFRFGFYGGHGHRPEWRRW
jgi:hypothetical protein